MTEIEPPDRSLTASARAHLTRAYSHILDAKREASAARNDARVARAFVPITLSMLPDEVERWSLWMDSCINAFDVLNDVDNILAKPWTDVINGLVSTRLHNQLEVLPYALATNHPRRDMYPEYAKAHEDGTLGAITMGQLIQIPSRHLMMLRNFGRKTLSELEGVLEEVGLRLIDA